MIRADARVHREDSSEGAFRASSELIPRVLPLQDCDELINGSIPARQEDKAWLGTANKHDQEF